MLLRGYRLTISARVKARRVLRSVAVGVSPEASIGTVDKATPADSTVLGEHRVTTGELFFDLVFVFAFTQVTGLMAAHPTWEGVGQGMLVLAAVWWAWGGYAWLTNSLHSDDGIARLGLLAAMGAMLVAALAVPQAFGDDSVVFGIATPVTRFVL